MNVLAGLKTLILMPLIGALSYKFQALTGIPLTPEQQLAIAAGAPTAAALALRFVTTSPVMSGMRNWVTQPKEVTLSPQAIEALKKEFVGGTTAAILAAEKVIARRIQEKTAQAEGVKTSD